MARPVVDHWPEGRSVSRSVVQALDQWSHQWPTTGLNPDQVPPPDLEKPMVARVVTKGEEGGQHGRGVGHHGVGVGEGVMKWGRFGIGGGGHMERWR